MEISARAEQIGDTNVAWREAPAAGAVPALYVHGVPTDGDDWLHEMEIEGEKVCLVLRARGLGDALAGHQDRVLRPDLWNRGA